MICSHYIYGFRCENYLKIGQSINPSKRMSAFNALVPYEMEMVFQREVPNRMSALAVEAIAIKQLKENDLHIKGEWFHYSPTALQCLSDACRTHSFDELTGYSETQEALKALAPFFGRNANYATSDAAEYLASKGQKNAARFVSTFSLYSTASTLLFPEKGSEYVLLQYMYKIDNERQSILK